MKRFSQHGRTSRQHPVLAKMFSAPQVLNVGMPEQQELCLLGGISFFSSQLCLDNTEQNEIAPPIEQLREGPQNHALGGGQAD